MESTRRLLQTSVTSVRKIVARNKDAALEERPYFFVDAETSCSAYDHVWAEFATACWDNSTRASECTSDEVKDSVADEDGDRMTHRIHWINQRLDDLLPIVKAMGQEEFGDSFTTSKPTLLNCNIYYHRYPGRNTCLCRYDM